MRRDAIHADIAIPMSLKSSTSLRWRTLHCMECGQPFLERTKDAVFRVNSKDMPTEAKPSADGTLHCLCGNCRQKYIVTLAEALGTQPNSLPLNMQPQSIFIAVADQKRLRDTYCLECGKAYYSISDRIRMVVDNVVPMTSIPADTFGPMEARCKFQHCKQRWYIRV